MQTIQKMLDRINSFLAYKLGWDMTISGLIILNLIVFVLGFIVFSSGKIAVVVFGIAVAGMLIWPGDKKNKNEREEK